MHEARAADHVKPIRGFVGRDSAMLWTPRRPAHAVIVNRFVCPDATPGPPPAKMDAIFHQRPIRLELCRTIPTMIQSAPIPFVPEIQGHAAATEETKDASEDWGIQMLCGHFPGSLPRATECGAHWWPLRPAQFSLYGDGGDAWNQPTLTRFNAL